MDEPIRLRVITWNMGDNKKTKEEWKAEVSTTWDIITNPDNEFDILFISLQEDHNTYKKMFGNKYGYFKDAVHDVLKESVKRVDLYEEVVDGPPGQNFSIKSLVYVKIGKNNNIDRHHITAERAQKCLKFPKVKVISGLSETNMCTKATLGLNLKLGNNQLIFMASHLPIVSGESITLGLEKRKEAVVKSLEHVYTKIVDETKSHAFAVWAGDMNFRCEDDQCTKEQLKANMHIFSTESKEFQEMDRDFPPTCKMRTCERDECDVCRNKSSYSNKNNRDCYKTSTKKGARIPSYCDRILWSSQGLEITPVQYKSISQYPSVGISDHNLVYADFIIRNLI